MPAAVIENDILELLDLPSSGEAAPSLANLEDALTSGYARAMALEAEESRVQRRIADVAVALADEEGRLPDPELKQLAHELKATRGNLRQLRALLESLRRRAEAARS